MRLFESLSIVTALTFASGAILSSPKKRRESKWDIIHHEYHGPPAPLSRDGRVIDTAEVAEAKANHFAIRAETIAELTRLMSGANELDAQLTPVATPASEAQAALQAAAPIIAAEVAMTPELMGILLEAAIAEQRQQQEQTQASPAPIIQVVPEAPPAPVVEEAAPEQLPAAEVLQLTAETPRQEDIKPIVEPELTNEVAVEGERPIATLRKEYQGPLAPLGQDGRVLDTFENVTAPSNQTEGSDPPPPTNITEPTTTTKAQIPPEQQPLLTRRLGVPQVRKLKEAHLHVYQQALARARSEASKRLYAPPPQHLLYQLDGAVGYEGLSAPVDQDGRVVDTQDVERAKAEHRRALEHAQAIAKRHPPKPDDNAL